MQGKFYEIFIFFNVTVYEGFNHELAFKSGDTFVLDEVKAYQLIEMSQQMDLAPRLVSNQLKKVCKEVLRHIDLITFEDLDTSEKVFIDKLVKNIKDRVNVLMNSMC